MPLAYGPIHTGPVCQSFFLGRPDGMVHISLWTGGCKQTVYNRLPPIWFTENKWKRIRPLPCRRIGSEVVGCKWTVCLHPTTHRAKQSGLSYMSDPRHLVFSDLMVPVRILTTFWGISCPLLPSDNVCVNIIHRKKVGTSGWSEYFAY